MATRIAYRGPDDSGVWTDRESGVALAHRRLSILDLSSAGHQPMLSSTGRFVIVFNGEIYNHGEIRCELESAHLSPDWKGHSDTETLVEAIAAWGVRRALQSTVGMFGLALWDRKEKSLTLARDRAGEKPLYYGWQRGCLLFASELKALKEHPCFAAEVDRDALALMARYNNVPAPYSIYRGIRKLMPGHFLTIPFGRSDDPIPVAYWSLNQVLIDSHADAYRGSAGEAIIDLEEKLQASVKSQMLADVPIGAFLSGGLDSSLIVALMQSQSSRPIKTFTIGFHNADYDEAVYARAVADHLGTSHTELYVTPEDAQSVIPDLPTIYCEPFADSSQIPTYLVSSLASEHVKVSLSGDAGDELFGGYNRYLMAISIWFRFRRMPRWVRNSISKALLSRSASEWDTFFATVSGILPRRLQMKMAGEKAHKLAGALRAEDGSLFYRRLVSHFENPASIVLDATEPPTLLGRPDDWPNLDNLVEWMMAMDFQTYMTDDILAKVDRAAMANSLESRVPFLDHRVVEFAWRLPLELKIREGKGKWIMRQILARYVPREMIERPKMGFANPLHDWLRGPLRDWAESLLDSSRLEQEGFFDPQPIRALWDAHLSGKSNEQYSLWIVLMFQAWLAEQ